MLEGFNLSVLYFQKVLFSIVNKIVPFKQTSFQKNTDCVFIQVKGSFKNSALWRTDSHLEVMERELLRNSSTERRTGGKVRGHQGVVLDRFMNTCGHGEMGGRDVLA